MGCLDEAVFDHINQLGFEGLDCMDEQLMGCLESIDPHVLEDLDSDSGLSLEMSSGGPVSPGWYEYPYSHFFSIDVAGYCIHQYNNYLIPHLFRLVRDIIISFIQFLLSG